VPSNPYLGVLAGTRVLDWVPCDTELRGFVVSGSAPSTQPSNPTGTNFAKYLDLGNGLILFKFHFIFDANTVFGTGEHIWAVRLPVPANRASGGADLTDGTALAWQGTAANPQLCMSLRPSLMDPMLHGGSQGMEDYYIQFFLPHMLAMGTGSISSAADEHDDHPWRRLDAERLRHQRHRDCDDHEQPRQSSSLTRSARRRSK
jgi:hypothetical protein